jgi:zinc transporter
MGDPVNSQLPGLTKAYLLGNSARALTPRESREWRPGDGVLWLHLDYTDPEMARWVREDSGVDAVVAEAILAPETRPRCLAHGDGLLLILRGVNQNPGADPEDMVSVRIWMAADRIISSGQRKLLSIDDLSQEIEQGTGPVSQGEFLVRLGELMADRIGDVVNDIDDVVDSLEDELLAVEHQELRYSLSNVRRQIVALRRYLAPQRDALARLVTERSRLIDDLVRMQLRELTDRMTRYIEDLDEARDRASVTHEELLNRLAELTNRRMYLLTMVAAIFIPLSFITGLLGVNVGGIPGAHNRHAFLIVIGLLVIVCVAQWFYFRWQKWF